MNGTTTIAAAQICAREGDIVYNLREHYRLIRLASEHRVRLLVFPEMSVTGYVREKADRLAFTPGDPRLGTLRQLAQRYGMIIVAGAPVRLGAPLHIGSFIIFPSGTEALYTKHYLHDGEADFYAPNRDFNPVILLGDEKLCPAVSSDIENPAHVAQAVGAGATAYMSSVFYPESGIGGGHRLLKAHAGKYALPILMSNYSGYHYHTPAGGRSAFWNERGEKLACLDKDLCGLVVAVKERGVWKAETAFDNSDVYTVCPVYQTRSLMLRRTAPQDAEALLKCYSDERAVSFFNSDNCNGDTFYYTTIERMARTIGLWEASFKARQFIRWTISANSSGEIIGTVEMFYRTTTEELGPYGLMRIDLRSDFETPPVISELLDIADRHFYDAFDVETIVTKAIPEAKARTEALTQKGYKPLEKEFLGFKHYYVKSKCKA